MIRLFAAKKSELILSFRADGPYWADLVHILAYPIGVSYVWPFRYDGRLVETTLQNELVNPDFRRRLSGKRVLIAARFHTAGAENLILPVRRAIISNAEFSARLYQFRFRLEGSFAFQDAPDLTSCCIPTGEHVDHLAFYENIVPPLRAIDDPEGIAVAWRHFAQLIEGENVLPINDEAKRSLYLNISHPTDGLSPVPTAKLKTASSPEKAYGYALKQGRQYVIRYSHYVPALERRNTTVREIEIEPKFSGHDIEVNAAESTLIGNYGLQSFLIAAVAPSAVWRAFSIAPKEKKLTSQQGAIEINTHRFDIPISVNFSVKWWLLHRAIPGLFLFIALTVIGVATLIEKNFEKLVGGSLKWSDVASNWYLVAIVLLGSLLATIAVPMLQGASKK